MINIATSHTSELYLSQTELEAGLESIRQSPKNNGTLESIVIRPQADERLILDVCELSPTFGVHGDDWSRRGTPHPKAQITLMNSRLLSLIAGAEERWALAGDQLIVDFDLSEDNLGPGERLAIGTVILEITDKPHRGCAKFAGRFGADALKFVNSEVGRHLRLRGIYAAVVQVCEVRVSDSIIKC